MVSFHRFYEREFREAMDRLARQSRLLGKLMDGWKPGQSETRLIVEAAKAVELCRAIPLRPPA